MPWTAGNTSPMAVTCHPLCRLSLMGPVQHCALQSSVSQGLCAKAQGAHTCSFIQALFTWYLQAMQCQKHLSCKDNRFSTWKWFTQNIFVLHSSAHNVCTSHHTGGIKVGKWKGSATCNMLRKCLYEYK